MADLGGTFDAENVEPLGDRTPIPAGDYRCAVIKSEWKKTKGGTGRYLEFVFQVLEGKHQGRLLWARLNLENKNAQAVQIARGELSSICRAVEKLKPKDSIELHGIPLIVKVGVKNREDNGEPTNEIKGYESVKGGSQKETVPSESSEQKPNWM